MGGSCLPVYPCLPRCLPGRLSTPLSTVYPVYPVDSRHTTPQAKEGDRPLAHTRQCEAYKITEDVEIFLAFKTMEVEGEISWAELAELAAEEFVRSIPF